jgi:hypothetical protein
MRPKTALRLLRAAIVTFALTGLAGSAGAQTANHLQLARELVDASGATRAFDPIVPSILQQAIAMFVQQNPDLQKQLSDAAVAIRPEFEKRRGEIVELVARVYASRFTEAELKEILTFYRSNVGKKFVNELPGVLDDSFRRTQEWAGKISEEVVSRMRAEMKKRGHTI